ncbi:CopG family transcriptional regulator [Brachybacterium sillae]|uniref:CopG family transcriptional regulator n=1 Tax=Brachybacterium sillae TaxID=2810536 RepID=UPI00217D7555|nr:CopG family transcriptional regulator [Brachybacterium sillae]
MTLRLTEKDEQALSDLATSRGTSRQAAVIQAIHEARDRDLHRQRVRSAARDATTRYADLLDRLGS